MALLLAGTTRLHSVGTTFEGRWKCPDEGNQAFSLHYSISNNQVFFACQWSVVLFGYGGAEEMKPEGMLKGKGSNCPKPANCVPWFFWLRQDVCYWVFFSVIFLPDRFRSNMNKYVLLCKSEAERCWFAVILLVPLFFLDITSCPLCPVFLVLGSMRLSLMAIGSHLG